MMSRFLSLLSTSTTFLSVNIAPLRDQWALKVPEKKRISVDNAEALTCWGICSAAAGCRYSRHRPDSDRLLMLPVKVPAGRAKYCLYYHYYFPTISHFSWCSIILSSRIIWVTTGCAISGPVFALYLREWVAACRILVTLRQILHLVLNCRKDFNKQRREAKCLVEF